MLRTSDVVCLCLALTEDTRGLMDKQRLGLMKPGALFINVARGALVDEIALRDALTNGAIRGAGLDVFEHEPFDGPPPSSIVSLAKLPNVVATPHLAYNTQETVTRLGQELLDDLESCITGTPINVVNK